MDRGAWWAIVHRVIESDMTEILSVHTHTHTHTHTMKIYCLSKLQIYNIVLLVIVTRLYIRPSEPIHLISENL